MSIRGCHHRDKGAAGNERLRDSKFIFSRPKGERPILLNDRNAAGGRWVHTEGRLTAGGQMEAFICPPVVNNARL